MSSHVPHLLPTSSPCVQTKATCLPTSAGLSHIWLSCPPAPAGLKIAHALTGAIMYVINPSLSVPFHHPSHSPVSFTLRSSYPCRSPGPPSAGNVPPSFARWSTRSLPQVPTCAFTQPSLTALGSSLGCLSNHLYHLLQLRCFGSTSPSCLSHGCYWPDSP